MASVTGIARSIGCERKNLFYLHFNKFFKKKDALIFGSAYHKSIEEGLPAGVNELHKEGLENETDLLIDMNKRITDLMELNNINIIEHEYKFEIDLGICEKFEGYIDAIAEMNGDIYLLEFKTARSINVDCVAVDSQITAYLWAVNRLIDDGLFPYDKPKGVLYIVNQKSKSKEPTILKNGHLSTSRTQGVPYLAYVEKANELYGDEIPEKILDYMNWLKDNDKPNIVMVNATRYPEELSVFEKFLYTYVSKIKQAKDMYESKGIVYSLKNTPVFPTKFCYDNCDFRNICRETMVVDHFTDGDLSQEFYETAEGINEED